MAELEWGIAKNLAGYLVTIGHPYTQVAIDGTAFDLIEWCKGAIIDGRIYSPQQQAEALIREARLKWETGWPEKGGTNQLHALFKSMFEPAPQFRVYEAPPPPSCEKCSDTGWETVERNGYTYSKHCKACGGKVRPPVICPDCAGKETKLINGKREWCKCVPPERREQMKEWLRLLNRRPEAS